MAVIVNKNSTFRLIALEVGRHPVLGDLTLTFDDDNVLLPPNEIYTTVVIGANGIGKTYLLKVIVDIFNYIYELNHSEQPPRSLGYSFEIRFWFNGQHFNIKNYSVEGYAPRNAKAVDKMTCIVDGRQTGVHNCLLPSVVVASAMTVTDKFPVKPVGEMYHYQGIRNEKSPSTTGTRTLVRKTVEGLVRCLKVKGGYREELALLLDVLGFQHSLKVKYQIKYKDVFLNPNMSPELLCAIFENKNNRYFNNRKTELWGKGYFDSIKNDRGILERICEYYRRISQTLDIKEPRLSVSYDVFQQGIEQDAETLLILSRLDIVSFPTILVSKHFEYDFLNSSSGETHILCQMIGLMSAIKNGGVVLIDEPETSSHPDWQMNYIGWLKKIFRSYSSCHFIIATHSPLILANVKAHESTIIRLRRNDEDKIVDEGGMHRGCYSWTIDEILHEVMRMEKENTDDYEYAIKAFETAVRNKDRKTADSSYGLLQQMINPKNELLELLKIQKAAIDDD